jgi:hypothetical protein
MNQYIITEELLHKIGGMIHPNCIHRAAELVRVVRSHPYQSERDKIICCARCPCKEPDCEDFCKHFQPLDNLMAVIRDGDLIESREALEHHFGRHDTCKSERTRCPVCKEELRQKAGE